MSNSKIITRFAPSPTGYLHIGGVRSALFSYLFAKQNNGQFFLRIEDTDKKRNKKEYEEDIIKGFKIVGLNWDNDPIYRQSDHFSLYKELIEKLIKEGKAYLSKEEVKEEGQRAEVIRFKNPNKDVVFEDLVHGEIKVNTTDLGDFIIARSVEEPIFHFANVVDDNEMGVTHIIRGEEHLPNTPRQILIGEALGFKQPFYAHIPLVLASDRSKLSKREGSVALREFLDKGYLPGAIINYLALLGWHPQDNQEIFTITELVKVFDLSRVQKAGAIWSEEKLDWVNKEHLKRMTKLERIEAYDTWFKKFPFEGYRKEVTETIEPIITERINKFSDIKEMLEKGDLQFFFAQPVYQKENLIWKGKGDLVSVSKNLEGVLKIISLMSKSDFEIEKIKNAVWPFAESNGRGEVLWPLRYSLSGREKSPDPFTIASVLGKEETIKRLEFAVKLING
jgi:glutamyl-tRNA synthetase/nondiscriminating glutamyl-tRNA synthetase